MDGFLTYAFVAAIAGGIGGVTGWVVNVFDLRKARLEIELLQEEVKKLNSAIRSDLTTEEVERYGRKLEQFSHQIDGRVLRRIGNFAHLSIFVAAAVTAGIFGGAIGVLTGGSNGTNQLAAARSDIRELSQKQQQSNELIGDVAAFLEFDLAQRNQLAEMLKENVLKTEFLPTELRMEIERHLEFLRQESDYREGRLTFRILEYLRKDLPEPERNNLIDALQLLQAQKNE